MKRLENFLQLAGRNANPGIFHLEPELLVFMAARRGNVRHLWRNGVFNPKDDLPLSGKFDRIA